MKKTDEEILGELLDKRLVCSCSTTPCPRYDAVKKQMILALKQARQSEREDIKNHLLKHGSGGGNWRRIIEQLTN